jgi:hypothetical protein
VLYLCHLVFALTYSWFFSQVHAPDCMDPFNGGAADMAGYGVRHTSADPAQHVLKKKLESYTLPYQYSSVCPLYPAPSRRRAQVARCHCAPLRPITAACPCPIVIPSYRQLVDVLPSVHPVAANLQPHPIGFRHV